MTTNHTDVEISYSEDCEKFINQHIQQFQIRASTIGRGTVIAKS